jgi:hypothetical protein
MRMILMEKPQQAIAMNKNRKEVKIRFVLAIVFTLTIIMSGFATAWAAVSPRWRVRLLA